MKMVVRFINQHVLRCNILFLHSWKIIILVWFWQWPNIRKCFSATAIWFSESNWKPYTIFDIPSGLQSHEKYSMLLKIAYNLFRLVPFIDQNFQTKISLLWRKIENSNLYLKYNKNLFTDCRYQIQVQCKAVK